MGFLDELGERFRDKTRDDVCDALRSLGVDARMAERGRAEEKAGKGSLGVIDISGSPISWVNVRARQYGTGDPVHYTDCGVPDPRLVLISSPKLKIGSTFVTTLPLLLGRVVELRWKGNDLGLGIIDRLNSDMSTKQPILKTTDAKIHVWDQCWIISTQWIRDPHMELSRGLWDFYQAIGQHLLAAEFSPA